MAKQEKLCAGCGAPLTFMNTPNFGSGYLNDGERVCRRCFARIVKVLPSFGLRSRKDHTTASIQQILHPEAVQADQVVQERKMTRESSAPDKLYTNHLRGIITLSRSVFDFRATEQNKWKVAHLLEDLFAQPDEVWQLELDEPHHGLAVCEVLSAGRAVRHGGH